MEKFLYVTPVYKKEIGLSVVIPKGFISLETTENGEVIITSSIEEVIKKIAEELKNGDFGHVSYFKDNQYVLNNMCCVEVTEVKTKESNFNVIKYTIVKCCIDNIETRKSDGKLAYHKIAGYTQKNGTVVYDCIGFYDENSEEIVDFNED
jgi:hypothetical protein